jgi:hypothetical protein
MAIVFDSDAGTITGLSVGGLPDGIVDAGTLATDSVDSAELINGAVDDSHMAAMAASKLTGALPAISGASLTGLTSSQMPTGSVLSLNKAESSGSQQTLATTSYTDLTGVTLTITPKSSSSKFLLIGNVNANANPGNGNGFTFKFVRDGNSLGTPGSKHEAYFDAPNDWYARIVKSKLDEPNTASAITYKIQVAQHNNNNVRYNYAGDGRFASELVIWEIQG